MDCSAQPSVGAAKRRREPMHWRHEQLSLRMALAAATHHSAQPRVKEGGGGGAVRHATATEASTSGDAAGAARRASENAVGE